MILKLAPPNLTVKSPRTFLYSAVLIAKSIISHPSEEDVMVHVSGYENSSWALKRKLNDSIIKNKKINITNSN